MLLILKTWIWIGDGVLYYLARFLRDSLHFVEQNKIGVWGWSYGGFLTAMIMASKDSKGLFSCGASVAPVSSWRMYGKFVYIVSSCMDLHSN